MTDENSSGGRLPHHHAPTTLITGANRGIGLELVRQYAREGWNVVATARDPEQAEDLKALQQEFSGIELEALDLAEPASIEAFVIRMGDRAIDLLLNNAGTMGPLPLEDHIHRQRFGGIDYDLWSEILLINTFGTVRLTEALMPNVVASQRRTIVMVSSTAGSIGGSDRNAMAYTTSKAALNKASTIIARAVAEQGVIVLVMCPGHVKTRLGIGGAGVEIDDSVTGMRQVISGLTLADSGTFLRYNGEAIPW
jgi:NAD(P)-dependent dehydrogenase (short-subunit alcohol dehydrogenase family)